MVLHNIVHYLHVEPNINMQTDLRASRDIAMSSRSMKLDQFYQVLQAQQELGKIKQHALFGPTPLLGINYFLTGNNYLFRL